MTIQVPLLEDEHYAWTQLESLLQAQGDSFDTDFKGNIQRLAISSTYALNKLCRAPPY